MLDFKNNKILLTGGHGFLGSHLHKQLLALGVPPENITIPRSATDDLKDFDVCLKLTKEADIIMHLAGVVGGIGFNQKYPGQLLYDNLMMGVNLIEAARLSGRTKKFVQVGTICAYPKFTPVPFKEDDLWNGYPEETNAPYGIAKKTLLVMLDAYKQQYNFPGIFLLPVNLYGPGDNFDANSSHVIPALIKKFYDAKQQNLKAVEVWGDGSATREFVYVDDCARAIIMATQKYEKTLPVNIGSGFEISIKELVNTIARIMEFKGEIVWDITKPNGQPKRKLDVSRAAKEFGFNAEIDFETGLKETIEWYSQNLGGK